MLVWMVNKRHFFFHAIPIFTIIAIVVVGISVVDSGGDISGLVRVIVFFSAALCSVLFSLSVFVYGVRRKCWCFVIVVIVLLAVIIVCFSEIAEGHAYLLLPAEHVIFYLLKNHDA